MGLIGHKAGKKANQTSLVRAPAKSSQATMRPRIKLERQEAQVSVLKAQASAFDLGELGVWMSSDEDQGLIKLTARAAPPCPVC